jgi:hypothetical protein
LLLIAPIFKGRLSILEISFSYSKSVPAIAAAAWTPALPARPHATPSPEACQRPAAGLAGMERAVRSLPAPNIIIQLPLEGLAVSRKKLPSTSAGFGVNWRGM